jgi:hypothetical protein
MAKASWTHRGLEKYLKVDELEDRGVYRIIARNIAVAVYRADRHEFIGIRTKFGSRFLDGEYHWDPGKDGDGTYGTAQPTRKLEIQLPAGIPAEDYLGPMADEAGREVFFDETPDDNGKGRKDYKPVRGWVYKDTGEVVPDGVKHGYKSNKALFDFLENLEKDLDATTPEWRTED